MFKFAGQSPFSRHWVILLDGVLERVIPPQHGVKNPIAIRLPSGQPIHFRHAIDGERMDCVGQFARPVDAKMAYRYVHYAVARQLERTLLAVQDCSRVVGVQPAGMTDTATTLNLVIRERVQHTIEIRKDDRTIHHNDFPARSVDFACACTIPM